MLNALRQYVSDNTARTPSAFASASENVRVYMDGCFDIMHSGHYNALRQAKTLGCFVFVLSFKGLCGATL